MKCQWSSKDKSVKQSFALNGKAILTEQVISIKKNLLQKLVAMLILGHMRRKETKNVSHSSFLYRCMLPKGLIVFWLYAVVAHLHLPWQKAVVTKNALTKCHTQLFLRTMPGPAEVRVMKFTLPVFRFPARFLSYHDSLSLFWSSALVQDAWVQQAGPIPVCGIQEHCPLTSQVWSNMFHS